MRVFILLVIITSCCGEEFNTEKTPLVDKENITTVEPVGTTAGEPKATEEQCPVWTMYNSSDTSCQCGDSLGGVVNCDKKTLQISMLFCYCMTYHEHRNETTVGWCLLMCHNTNLLSSTSHVHTSQLNHKICGPFNRKGQLCGNCTEDHGLPVYSYSMECVQCTESDLKKNLLKYIAVAFLPLTVFYFLVIIFKISITSGNMVGYILTCQIMTSPMLSRAMYGVTHFTDASHVVMSCFSVWNLDFFRSLYTPFCIHPKLNTLHVLALDYLIGVYPLLLILLTYIAVTLHDRYPIVVKAWKPAYKIFMCIRREWNIRGSLIQAFATFLILLYVKILNVSFDLLFPIYLKNIEGNIINRTYLLHNGEIEYFGSQHLPYGILAITMLTIFNILPMIMLFLYPGRCFWFFTRRWCNHLTIQTVMDAFQGCYRYHPRNYRYLTAVYLFVRFLFSLTIFLVRNSTILAIIGVYYIILAAIILVIEPYQNKAHNKIDILFFLLHALAYLILCLNMYIHPSTMDMSNILTVVIVIVTFAIGLLYSCVILQNFLPKKQLLLILHKIRNTIGENDLLPHWFKYKDENSPLISHQLKN